MRKNNQMNRYIIGRVLFVIPIMLILSFFTFALTYLSPSDPITLKYERMGAVPDKALVEAEKEAAASDYQKLQELTEREAEYAAEYDSLMETWETLSEAIEAEERG